MEATQINYSEKIENNNLNIGEVEVAGSISSEFVYDGPKGDIRDVIASCGSCTSAPLNEVYEKDGKTYIPFTYTDTHVDNEGTRNKYPEGIIKVSKNITLLFEDGTPYRVPSTTGPGFVRNPDTQRAYLTYNVDVKIK